MKFAQMIMHAYKYTSEGILVPTELLEDSAFNLAELLGSMLGERLGRICNQENTLGTGNSMPKGITVAAPVGYTTAASNIVLADELIHLVHSVDPAYRPDSGFMMHDSTILSIRLLKDGQGQYLWQSGLQQGVPDRLFSYMLTTNQDMAVIGSQAIVALFGQLQKYKIREVRDIRLYRLQERYRDVDQDGFMAFFRQDGNLLDAGTGPVKSLKMAA
jgi:HK97 family phage major capsid protein